MNLPMQDAHKQATLEEIREYLVSDTKTGKGLDPRFVNACDEASLRRQAELNGEWFAEWLLQRRRSK